MASSFYTDGYNDGFAGFAASPPGPWSCIDGDITVFDQEYLQGWVAGREARRQHDDNERVFAAKGGYLNHV